MGNYETLMAFFHGDYLELRHQNVINNIKEHTRQTIVMLMAHLDKNEEIISTIEREKVLAVATDLQEVVFIAENLHIYIVGMGRVTSTEQERNRKVVEIKNQGQWIARHLPALWDAVVVYTRFDKSFGRYLNTHPILNLHYFEAIGSLTADMSKAPFAYLKLTKVQETDKMVRALLASTLAVAVLEQKETVINVDEAQARALAKIQDNNWETIASTVLALIAAYENAAGTCPMGESEEALRLIDQLEQSVKHLKREYALVFETIPEAKELACTPAPVNTVESLGKSVSRLQELLRKRLGK